MGLFDKLFEKSRKKQSSPESDHDRRQREWDEKIKREQWKAREEDRIIEQKEKERAAKPRVHKKVVKKVRNGKDIPKDAFVKDKEYGKKELIRDGKKVIKGAFNFVTTGYTGNKVIDDFFDEPKEKKKSRKPKRSKKQVVKRSVVKYSPAKVKYVHVTKPKPKRKRVTTKKKNKSDIHDVEW